MFEEAAHNFGNSDSYIVQVVKKMFISNVHISGFMPNFNKKKSLTVSTPSAIGDDQVQKEFK